MNIQHNGTTRKLTPLLMKDFLVAQARQLASLVS